MEEDKVQAPNTRFEQRPQTQADDSVFKQPENSPLYNSTIAPAKRYYQFLKMLTQVGKTTVENIGGGLAETGKLIADTPGAVTDKVKEGVGNLKETAEETPSLLEVMKMLRDKPGTLEGIPENE
jgi:hypothetical protein